MNYVDMLIPYLDGDVGDATRDDNNNDDHNDIEFLKKTKVVILQGSPERTILVCALAAFSKLRR